MKKVGNHNSISRKLLFGLSLTLIFSLTSFAQDAAAPAAPAKLVKTPGLFWPLTAALVAFGGVAALIIAGSK